MSPFDQYLSDLSSIRATGAGTQETSYYPALAALLNTLGQGLKPNVLCVLQLQNKGAGLPDGGLFTQDQLRKTELTEAFQGQKPARGVVEIKGVAEGVETTAQSAQVQKYLAAYGLVLVTNYRDFLLLGAAGVLERFTLAETEAGFWLLCQGPAKDRRALEEPFLEFMRRVLLYNAPLADPKDVAWFLASYAREARARVEAAEAANDPVLGGIKAAMEQAVGIHFQGAKGGHFFLSTLVQTLFYGVFSAWVLWDKSEESRKPGATFLWRTSASYLHVPMIQALFEEVGKISTLRKLELLEVLDNTQAALNRVQRAEFFARFQDGEAVQYFYEPFLEAFDPALRKELGVWYTPREIVRYMVERVDRTLREELGCKLGLADPGVVVLDPACGTGAFLMEVLEVIAATLKNDPDRDALSDDDLKRIATERVFGFELLPAPYVVAHMQLGLKLNQLGAPLADTERVGVFLTNALTGWEPVQSPKDQMSLGFFTQMRQERDLALDIKQKKPILVILGNPPYNSFAGTSPADENLRETEGLVAVYKKGLREKWGIKKYNLDDLYVRFFRIAERRIAEKDGRGIVCYISNFSYLREPSFVVMRERLQKGFDKLWFDNLNGDSRETGKVAPDGSPDPSVFSTEQNKEGIRKGTAIALLARTGKGNPAGITFYREFWGRNKRQELLESLKTPKFYSTYTERNPSEDDRFAFRSGDVDAVYRSWPALADLCLFMSNGLMEKRGGALIDIDREALAIRMSRYFDAKLGWDEYQKFTSVLTEPQAGFDPKTTRIRALKEEAFSPKMIVKYQVRPFDRRYAYYTGLNPIWNRSRPSYFKQFWEGNKFLVTRFNSAKDGEGKSMFFTTVLLDDHCLKVDASAIPLQLKNGDRIPKSQHKTLFDTLGEAPETDVPFANLSKQARNYLLGLGFTELDALPTAGLVWHHALAVGYSDAYLTEHAEGIRQDWPRIPLPASRHLLETSAALGRQVAALLDTELPVPGITEKPYRPEMLKLGITSVAPPGTPPSLAVTANWGHGGGGKPVMPARGRADTRAYTPEERAALTEGFAALGITPETGFNLVGTECLDVWLNDTTYWKCVPACVWDYHIGGYQVLKKWLSYREQAVLGRPLLTEEARYFQEVVRRIAALLLLGSELDKNYQACAAGSFSNRKGP